MWPLASVILLTKNGARTLPALLAHLLPSVRRTGSEVVAIDSGSTDESVAILERDAVRVERIAPGDFGHGRTRNLGGRLTQGQFLVFLTQDAIPVDDRLLEALLAPFEDETVAGVYGRQLPRDTHILERFALEEMYPAVGHRKQLLAARPIELRDVFFSNVCSALRRSIWERIPFDDHLIMSEDQQWSRDVLRAGYAIVYEPRAAVWHSHARSLGQVFRRNFDSGASLNGLVDDGWRATLRFGIRFVVREAVYLARERSWSLLPYLPVYEVARVAGFMLGQRHRWLPAGVRRALSEHRYHWDREPR